MQMKKIYLSMSQSKLLSSEFPIGDPYSGAAYGKKEAPAVVGIAMMYGAATAAATTMLAAVATGLTFIGGFLTTAGSLSGNEGAMKMGSYLGIAGAGAGLANWATAGSSAAGASGAGAAEAGATTSAAETTVAGEMVNAPAYDAGAVMDGAATESLASSTAPAPSAAVSPSSAEIALADAGGPSFMPGSETVGSGIDSYNLGGGELGSGVGGANLSSVSEPSGGGIIDGYMKFAKENPKVAEQGFALVSGAANAYSDKKKLDAQKDIYGERNRMEAERLALEKEILARKRANANNITDLRRFAAPTGLVQNNMARTA